MDEAIHLAAVMRLIGYRHVIATLWSISDMHAVVVAESVYGRLTGPGDPDPGRAGEALHHAVMKLLDAYPGSPLLWAAYIHVGP